MADANRSNTTHSEEHLLGIARRYIDGGDALTTGEITTLAHGVVALVGGIAMQRAATRLVEESRDAAAMRAEKAEAECDARPEISAEDAAAWSVPLHLRRGPDSASATKGAAGRRIRAALRAHASKVAPRG